MHVLQDGLDVDHFFQRLAAASHRLLLLDYDGTLAPFRVERDAATPYPGVREALDPILAAETTRVVVISGRAAAEVPHLLGLRYPVEIWGSHGAERLMPHGAYTLASLPQAARDGFRQAREWAAAHGVAGRLEKKPAALALHWRGAPASEAAALSGAVFEGWSPIARTAGLEVRAFDGGLELRVPEFDKGAVVRSLLDEAGEGAAAAFLGDDLTDEDAFAAIEGRGLGVLVRPALRPTRAALWLRPPDELLDFFAHWARAAAPSAG
ncbi:MAG TPA: trehalose-phosphatase [Roseiflexaceae bacterium]|nr:trehalose-phosphatase [Roseiflexaceae bacterium]